MAKRHEETLRCMHASFGLEPFYTGLYNARRPPTPEAFAMGLKVEVERLRLELLLSEPPPLPQCGLPPRRLPVRSLV